MELRVGDICLLTPLHFGSTHTCEVIIRGPAAYDDFDYTVEAVTRQPDMFHRCSGGAIEFQEPVGRWAHTSELKFLRRPEREPSRFGKFIKRIES